MKQKSKHFMQSFASLKRSSKKNKEKTERSLKNSQIKEFITSQDNINQEVIVNRGIAQNYIENPNIVNYLFENLMSKVDYFFC